MTVGDIQPHMLVTASFDWRQMVVVHVFRRDLDGCPMALCAWLDIFGNRQSMDYPVVCLSRAGPYSENDDDTAEAIHMA